MEPDRHPQPEVERPQQHHVPLAEMAHRIQAQSRPQDEGFSRWPTKLARSKAELVRTVVVCVVLVCQILNTLYITGVLR